MDGADHVGEPVNRFGRRVAVALAVLVAGVAAAAGQEAEPEIVPPPSRNVTPPGMTPGPAVDGPLTRVPTPPRPPDPPRWQRYFLPQTPDGATFVTSGLTIRISGVAPPPVDKTCRKADGEEWPCGRVALFALRMFLRGRAVECYFPPLGDVRQVIAPCRVGKVDLGAWLIAEGWATPDENATEAYREAAAAARCKRLGLWRGTPSDGNCPATDN